MSSPRLVTMVPQMKGLGGAATFQRRLAAQFESQTIQVSYDLSAANGSPVLVINGIRDVHALFAARRRGCRIVQRVGLPNPCSLRTLGVRGWFLSHVRNRLMAVIRRQLAHVVVYQSQRVYETWEALSGATQGLKTIILNGVDLDRFTPAERGYSTSGTLRLISVEGVQGTDPHHTVQTLARLLPECGFPVEILCFGKSVKGAAAEYSAQPNIRYLGVVDNELLPEFYRSADCFILTDHNGACPNSLIEALACGTPALVGLRAIFAEMVTERGGGLFKPAALATASAQSQEAHQLVGWFRDLMDRRDWHRDRARRVAEEKYDLRKMADAYCSVLFGQLPSEG